MIGCGSARVGDQVGVLLVDLVEQREVEQVGRPSSVDPGAGEGLDRLLPGASSVIVNRPFATVSSETTSCLGLLGGARDASSRGRGPRSAPYSSTASFAPAAGSLTASVQPLISATRNALSFSRLLGDALVGDRERLGHERQAVVGERQVRRSRSPAAATRDRLVGEVGDEPVDLAVDQRRRVVLHGHDRELGLGRCRSPPAAP